MDRTKELEAELNASNRLSESEKTEGKKWAQIYSYSYNESLTGCVEQLLELEQYTKAIVGEQGYCELLSVIMISANGSPGLTMVLLARTIYLDEHIVLVYLGDLILPNR